MVIKVLSEISQQNFQPHGMLFGSWIYSVGLTSFDRKVNQKVNLFRGMAKGFIQKRVEELSHSDPNTSSYSDIVEALMTQKLMS